MASAGSTVPVQSPYIVFDSRKAGLISIVVAAQLVASLALDHVGAIGFARHANTGPRVLGALLLIAGVALIVRN